MTQRPVVDRWGDADADSGYQTKAQVAISALRIDIRGGALAPGQKIDVEALGRRLNMSATPIREALRILESEGLVVGEPHHGIRVADFSTKDAAALYDLRALLESYATVLVAPHLSDAELEELTRLDILHREALQASDNAAADRYNEQWHFQIYHAAGSQGRYLLEFISKLWNAFPWTTAWIVPGRDRRSIKDHADIMAALRRHNSERAGALMREHILAGKDFVLRHLATTQAAGGASPGLIDASEPD